MSGNRRAGPVRQGPATRVSQTAYSDFSTRSRETLRSLRRILRVMAHSSPPRTGNKCFGRFVDSCIGKMRVLQRGRRIVVAQQPADREDRLAMSESHRCICVTKIMAADILDARSVRTFHQNLLRALLERWQFRCGAGNTHGLDLGRPSRIRREADDSQTVRGPVLLSESWRFPSRYSDHLSVRISDFLHPVRRSRHTVEVSRE